KIRFSILPLPSSTYTTRLSSGFSRRGCDGRTMHLGKREHKTSYKKYPLSAEYVDRRIQNKRGRTLGKNQRDHPRRQYPPHHDQKRKRRNRYGNTAHHRRAWRDTRADLGRGGRDSSTFNQVFDNR